MSVVLINLQTNCGEKNQRSNEKDGKIEKVYGCRSQGSLKGLYSLSI